MLLHGKLRQRNQFWVTEHELLGNGEAPVHTVGLVPVHPATQGISPARLRAARERGPLAHARGGRAAAGAAARRGGPAPTGRPRSPPCTSRTARRTSARRAAGSPSRSCSCSSSRWRDAGAPGARGGAPGRSRRAAWWWIAGAGRSRSSSRATSSAAIEEIDADLAQERPMQRLLMGEVGSGKTVRRAGGHAARRRERRPGSADGAHGDARRAAPPHARLAARRPAAGRAPHRLHERGAAARAARPAGERAAPAGRRHARADRGAGGVPRPRGRGGRRAAPLRRAPARGARREGAGRASCRTRFT